MNLRATAKRFFYLYRRFIWHKTQGYGEIMEPLNGLSAMVNIFTFIAVVFSIKFTWWIYALLFIGSVIVLGLIGILLVKSGIIAYVTKLNNSQNPELLEIKKILEEMRVEKNE